MAKRYSSCLIGCGRMGATIDDEVRDPPKVSMDSVLARRGAYGFSTHGP